MRWILGICVLVVLAVVGATYYAIDLPFKKYSGWVSGKEKDRYFEISNYRDIFLSPTPLEAIPPYQEDYTQLWKQFPLRNAQVPLPTRHPLYQIVPIVELRTKTSEPQFGIIFQDPTGREISRVYTLANSLYQDQSQGQDLFKLPFFRKRILNKNLDELWKDIFSYKIEVKDKPIDQMIYDLYILHIRSKILPADTIRYGLLKDGTQAMVELSSEDKDYMVELVITQNNGTLFSYLLKTAKNQPESVKLRAKFLQSITFSPIDESMGRLLYTEFKQLNYARQVDQEGMLYLFSAWSQNPDNVDMLRELINFLERGVNTKKQLKALYAYSYKRYGKTFTNRKDIEEQDNPEIDLQRKIELEQKELLRAAEANSNRPPEVQELTPEEKMNLYLKKAKEKDVGPKDSQEILVH